MGLFFFPPCFVNHREMSHSLCCYWFLEQHARRMRCHRNISSHLSRWIPWSGVGGIGVLLSAAWLMQPRNRALCSTDLVACGPQIGINLGCSSKDGWFGLWCTPWSGLQRKLWSLSLFLFPDEEIFVLNKDPDTWSDLKTGPSAFVWDSAGWDKWHLLPSEVIPQCQAGHHLQFLLFVTFPISAQSWVKCPTLLFWAQLLPGGPQTSPFSHELFRLDLNTLHHTAESPWNVYFGNAQYSWIQQSTCDSFSEWCIFCFDGFLGKP